MAKTKIGIDTSVFIYLLEDHPRYGTHAERLLDNVYDGVLEGIFSLIGMIELLTGPKKVGRNDLALMYEQHISTFPHLSVVNLSESIAWIASDLRAVYGIRVPDAIHLATAIDSNADEFVTNDKALRKVKEITVRLL